jgi:hypothetical protein
VRLFFQVVDTNVTTIKPHRSVNSHIQDAPRCFLHSRSRSHSSNLVVSIQLSQLGQCHSFLSTFLAIYALIFNMDRLCVLEPPHIVALMQQYNLICAIYSIFPEVRSVYWIVGESDMSLPPVPLLQAESVGRPAVSHIHGQSLCHKSDDELTVVELRRQGSLFSLNSIVVSNH